MGNKSKLKHQQQKRQCLTNLLSLLPSSSESQQPPHSSQQTMLYPKTKTTLMKLPAPSLTPRTSQIVAGLSSAGSQTLRKLLSSSSLQASKLARLSQSPSIRAETSLDRLGHCQLMNKVSLSSTRPMVRTTRLATSTAPSSCLTPSWITSTAGPTSLRRTTGRLTRWRSSTIEFRMKQTRTTLILKTGKMTSTMISSITVVKITATPETESTTSHSKT